MLLRLLLVVVMVDEDILQWISNADGNNVTIILSYPLSSPAKRRCIAWYQSSYLRQNPLLAGIKHLNRLEQVLIKYHLENRI